MSDKNLQGIWTQYGQERMAAWMAGGEPLTITVAAVGNGGGTIPDVSPSQKALVSEEWRGLVNGVRLNPNDATDVIVEVVLPNDIGGFWIREWGLFDDAGKLVAVGPHDEMHKPLIATGQAAEMLELFHLPVSNSGAVTLSIVTQALATQQFVASQVAAHDEDTAAHNGLIGKMDAALMEHAVKTLEQGAHFFSMGEEGQILSVQNGRLAWIDRYDIAQYQWFEDEMPRPGMVPLHGLWVDNFSRYTKAVEYFESTWGQKRLVTLAEYNARHVAIWHTNADGSTVGWEGEGGVNVFVWDKVNDRLLVPDVAGMTREQASAALGVGGVHGDATRRFTAGWTGGWAAFFVPTMYALGAAYTQWSAANQADAVSGSFTTQPYQVKIDNERVMPVTAKNQTRAFGSNCCVYLGKQAS